jgi:hypothetical protein
MSKSSHADITQELSAEDKYMHIRRARVVQKTCTSIYVEETGVNLEI